ncbi:MAG TPA: Dabb family protein [Candidatus Paceibacterota bacterium]|nr:Dabb family protein [Candidatus Paceibacterota bacterium]
MEKEYLSHVVLISFYDTATEEERQKVFDSFQTLPEECGGKEAGILYFQAGHNLDMRKNVHLVVLSLFRDNAALQAYRNHPKHLAHNELLKRIADWQIGDLMTPSWGSVDATLAGR